MSDAVSSTASILAVGSELLGTTRLDTNSLFLTGELETMGLRVVRKACVGDEWPELEAEMRLAMGRAPLLVVSGGLGPTADDRTKEVLAAILGRKLVRDEEILGRIRERFRRRGWEMPSVNEKQADIVEGAVVLENRPGSAPGFLVEEGGRAVVLLPGVPVELKTMWADEAAPRLARLFGRAGVHRRILKVGGLPESFVEERIQPVYAAHAGSPITILANAGEVQLHFAASGTAEEAEAILDRIEADFRKALGDSIFGRDAETLEGNVGSLLRSLGQTLALAESCTGGLIAGRLTEAPGASDYFLGSAVTYANSAKAGLVGVRPETLERFGAVSEETAREMAAGARVRFGATIGFSVTGIAGPTGGSAEKPVGTVHMALDGADGARLHRSVLFAGDRALVRRWTVSAALVMIRQHLMKMRDGGGT